MAITCPACGVPASDADRFCEACGADFRPKTHWLSSASPDGVCNQCGATPGPEGYCGQCGRRRGAGMDRAELELESSGVAAGTDRARRRHNEDAVVIGQSADAAVAIICDGVSTSSHAADAAYAAAHAGIEELLRDLADGGSATRASTIGFRAALAAVALLCGPETQHNAPSCTYVSAVRTAATLTIGWVGDSRAYWVPAGGADRVCCLTVDDSAAGYAAAAGLAIDPALLSQAAFLTRWVGADAGDVELQIVSFDPAGPGSLVLCSDGLSRYLATADGLAVIAGVPPMLAARRLTQFALDAGGADNIAVAVLSFPSPDPSGASKR